MSVAGLRADSTRTTTKSLVRALAISLAVHCLGVGIYSLGHHYGIWTAKSLPTSLTRSTAQTLAALQKLQPKPLDQDSEPPLMFVDVNPRVATPEPPPKAQYYSARNSEAANPDPRKDTEKPKIDGTQVHVAKTETITNPKSAPTPPAPLKEPEPPKEIKEAEAKPKGGPKAGDLAVGKPDPKPGEGLVPDAKGLAPAPAKPTRIRTLAAAKALQPDGGMVGQKMLQDGGVKKSHIAPALDVKASPFGDYDARLIAAIENRWWALLQDQHFARDATGSVVVAFRLTYEGKVTEMKIDESNVGDLLGYLCERAISDPAPFAKWPSDMLHLVGKNYREVRFTFYYE